jgi:tousled-like kinase
LCVCPIAAHINRFRPRQSLDHPRIIRLLDVFEYDHFSFCTVLEFCEGKDLESYLQAVKTVPEREARSLVCQVVSALKYMNELPTPIIHYDLKPGNILLYHGHVKITDFGLSKIVEALETGGGPGTFGAGGAKETDLTSQGAGTYWYLPPEVFDARPGEPVKISSKVDVWSLGVIFFEILYGSKPFGNNKSQYTILKESIITNDAQYLTFPAKPTVSQETKVSVCVCGMRLIMHAKSST